jgi:hypothetical protein
VFSLGRFYYLFLCPDLYPGQTTLEPQPPLVGAVVDPAQVRHDRVKGPHVHKVEQLREQLDRQGRVHTTLPADQFKSRVTKIFPGKNFRETQVSTKNWKNLLQFKKEIKNSETQ